MLIRRTVEYFQCGDHIILYYYYYGDTGGRLIWSYWNRASFAVYVDQETCSRSRDKYDKHIFRVENQRLTVKYRCATTFLCRRSDE